MKTILAWGMILWSACAAHAGDGLFAEKTFDAAKAEAARDGKIVLIDFYTTWCGPCKMLDKETWTDKEVIQLLQAKAVCLRLDAEKETNLAGVYHIDAYPTMMLLKADGSEMERLVGFREPKKFIADFDSALAGKGSLARAEATLASEGTNDPNARMHYGQALAEKRQYAEALREYLWCFDHGTNSPAFVGVRGSFLLSYIIRMGAAYPPARAALEKRRDQDEARIRAGSSSFQAAMDAVDLNKALGQDDRNVALFDALPPASIARKGVVRLIFDELIRAKRYKDALEGSAPATDFAQSVENFERVAPLMQRQAQSKQIERMMRASTVKKGAGLYEALAGVKNNDAARALAAKIIKFDGAPDTRRTLAEAADRAGNTELAKEMKNAKQ